MAIEPFLRVRDRLTNKNFIDAEQLDFEFNKFTDYLNNKLLPSLNSLFDLQVLASQIPIDVGGYLYEDDTASLTWKKPDNAGLLLNLLEPSIYNISFVGQKAGENHLSYLQVIHNTDGIVFCKNNTGFEIKKVANANLSIDIFDDNNFAVNSISQNKLAIHNDITILKPTLGSANFFQKNLTITREKLSFGCIPNSSLKSQNFPQSGSYQTLAQLNTHCRLLPEGLFGATGKWQLTEYKVDIQAYGYVQVGDLQVTGGSNANFDTLNPLPTIAQALYDPADYARNEIFKGRIFSLLSLTIHAPLSSWYSYGSNVKDRFKMNIPPRCFADKSVGIKGSHYDYICFLGGEKTVLCFPQTNTYDYTVRPTYNIDNLLAADITLDCIEDDIIDIDFFPKRIQDKINARP